ncbi:hypothetical protein QFC21_004669 [Naganishia friedmannii]|uniref:Uncharacterized protein n=1 Tax=Naganishia friedmannii TaxID=89922 RepID=A0ACC2VES4_9TREE|nr:hypothetical protein QFC21_004669 [Naganishia friedmannii]
MLDFHPGYSIGTLTVPLTSLNAQLKTIAKQLGNLADLQGALAAQISELSRQQGSLVETLRQLEEMTTAPELPADIFEVIASHLAGDNALRSLANLNVASRMVHEATNSTLYETVTWDREERSWWKRFTVGEEGEKMPRRWKYVKYMLLYAYHDVAMKEDLSTAFSTTTGTSTNTSQIIPQMFPNIRALLLVPPLQPHRWHLTIYQSVSSSTLFGNIFARTPNTSRPACMTEEYDLVPDPHPVLPICPIGFERLDVVVQKGAQVWDNGARVEGDWWNAYQVNKLRIEIASITANSAIIPGSTTVEELDATSLAQLYKLLQTTAQRSSEKAVMSSRMMDWGHEVPSLHVHTETVEEAGVLAETMRQLGNQFPHLASLNTTWTTQMAFPSHKLELILSEVAATYASLKPKTLPTRSFIEISHAAVGKSQSLQTGAGEESLSGQNMELDTDPALEETTTLAQVAAERVQDLVETAADLLGTPQLDDSSLGKLAQMSKALELETEVNPDVIDEEGVLVRHPQAGDEQEEPEEAHELASNHYVTAPSSPIIHVSTFTSVSTTTISTTDVSTTATTTTTPTTPGLSRRGSKDALQHHVGRKLRFTTITGQSTHQGDHQASGRKSTSLDVQFNEDHWVASDPGTPNISETANQIRRTLSLASVDSLLKVAQDQETRDQFLDNVKEHGKRMVWRDERERRKLPGDAERALVLAVKRGLRSFILAFAVRAGVNLLLTLIRTLRKGRLRWLLIRHAIFSPESFRFGGMIGTFTLLNTLTLHLLRLAPPTSYIKKRLRRVLQQDRSPLTYGPPERWNGRVDVESGDYTMEEEDTGERRWQAAVAGAVGSLGLLWESKERRVGVAQHCGQIMFAFLLSPETIPPEYNTWIQAASQVQGDAVKLNRMIERQRKVDPGLVMKIMQHKNITPHNKRELTHVLEQAKLGLIPEGVPWKSFIKNPLKMLGKAMTLEGNTVGALPEKMQALLKRKENFWLIGFATCFSLFAEEKKRRAELAWSSARKRAWVPIVPFGETILGMAAMAMVMDAYKAFYFQWSSTSYQCYTQTLSWVGGTPPFRAVIAPILQMPFVYDIPASAYVDGKGSYDVSYHPLHVHLSKALTKPRSLAWQITVQLTSGLSYVIMMGDAAGMGTGGSSGRITVQGYAESDCLEAASRNQTTLDVSFMVSATNIQQCRTSYNMSWDATAAAVPPYNMTVISLDQSFNPFDVPFGTGNTSSYDWQVSVAAGKSFTVMMNDGKGYGYGGVGGTYTVNRTSAGNTQCDFVGGSTLTTTTSSPSSTGGASTSSSSAASTGDPAAGEGAGGPPKGTVIAGASIGALVGIGLSAAVAFLIFFYRRRRRNRRRTQQHSSSRGKDNGGDGGSVVMADGRRRPADAMSVNLFDDDGEHYLDPNDGHYAPIPYDGGSYSGSPVTPGSTLSAPPRSVSRATTTIAGRTRYDDSPITSSGTATATSTGDNPFESGRELHGEEAKAALFALGGGGGRSWSGASGDTLQSRATTTIGGGVGSLHRLDTFTDPRGPLSATTTPNTGREDGWGDSVPPPRGAGIPRTKSEEALADVADSEGPPTRNRYTNDTSHSPAITSPLLSPPPSSGPGTGGGFRITNVSDSDPLLPRSQTSSTIGTTATNLPPSSHGRRPRGEPRFVRHADAGRAPQREEEVIDLPPLYTDLVREDDPPPPMSDLEAR